MDRPAGHDAAGPVKGVAAWLWRRSYLVLLVVLMLLFTAYALTHRSADAIRRDYIASGRTVMDLPKSVPSAWQRVCIFKPYSQQSDVTRALGFAWDVEAHSSITEHEHINLLVFINGWDVVAAVDYPRADGDLARLPSTCYRRADAKFTQLR
ncbi:MAG: hypothetical protein V4631_01075 [Pseudomonadota bacterium]